MSKKDPYAQNLSEVAAMLDFYKQSFSEVYSVTCLEHNHVIGVEVSPIRADGIILERKGRTFYNYQDLTLSVRERLDTNDQGNPMYGYQCVCGNNTILAKVEQGEVPERSVVVGPEGVVSDSGPVAAASPYEQHLQANNIRLKAADKKADYELSGNVERYETFKIERVK